MIIEYAELWKRPRDLGIIAVTTNSIMKFDGGLVMGRGSAGDAAKRIPGIQHEIVAVLQNIDPQIRLNGTEDYGFVVIRNPNVERCGFAVFQAKRHWQDVSSGETIAKSVAMLAIYAREHPAITVRAPMPGWGCGQLGKGAPLTKSQILDLLKPLPDNCVFVIRASDKKE